MDQVVLRLRSERVEWRVVEAEIVALTLADERYLGINAAGALLWQALAEGAERPALIDVLVAAGASEDRVEAELDSFLAALRMLQLLLE